MRSIDLGASRLQVGVSNTIPPRVDVSSNVFGERIAPSEICALLFFVCRISGDGNLCVRGFDGANNDRRRFI